MDRLAPKRCAKLSAARQRQRPDAENFGGEVSLDHLVGAGEERRRHFEAKHPCGLSVNDELELAHLLDRQFPRLYTLEDAPGIDADDTPRIRDVGPVAHQPAGLGDFTRGGCHGNRVARRHGGQLNPPAVEKSAGAHEEGIGPLAHKRSKCAIDLAAVGSVEDLDLQPEGTISTATRAALGTSSRSSSSRFATNSELKKLIPVRLPPGRARLATRPNLTGSSAAAKTMGIVVVAALAANVAAVLGTTMTATCRRTNSSASTGSRSYWPSAQRYSITMFSPST